ncbi:MAG: hypothetical protein GQ534_11700 [Candidatus Delongbacteria bacterium]|nr:hypothetical protein [Candidatus Delongbacteria bacterium]
MKQSIIYILILISLVFSQDVYRLNDSTFVYPCIGDSTTMLNFVGLPLESDYVIASDFDSEGTNINSISRLDAEAQGWYTAGHHPALGWGTDFPVETGGAYLINAINDFDFTVTGDSVDVVYDLITTSGSDLNFLVHPLTKPELTMAGVGIGDDIGYVGTLNRWENSTQQWVGTTYNSFLGWLADYPTEVGMPLMVNMTADTTWPILEKSENNLESMNNTITSPKINGGGPRVAYFHYQDASGEELDFPEEASNLDFSAYIPNRPGEVLRKDNFGCGFTNIDGYSVAYINLGNFPSSWSAG